jgi:FlaA1/EpsC-like NDP-sugar epimerase
MSVSKEYLPPSAESPSAPKPKPDLYRRVISRLPGLVLRPWVQHYMLNRRVQMIIDAVIATACFIFAHILRFDGWPPGIEDNRMFLVLPYLVAARISANYWLGLYLRVWRYISIPDAIHLAGSVGLISSVLLLMRLGFTGVSPYLTAPIGVIIIDFVLTTSMMLCVRLLWRVTCETAASAKTPTKEKRLRTLLVGAGSAGIMTAREISRRRDLGMQVCGFLDDDYSKQKSVIQGVSVLGGSADLPFVVRTYRIDQVIITMANAHRKMIRNLIDLCDAARVPVKIIPKLHEILGDQVTISSLRPVEIEDLLGRDAIDVNAWLEASQGSYRGKRVLITGAGGSIGRELCRQLATLNPASIIQLDKDENSVFEAERELRLSAADREIKIIPVICDLRMPSRLDHVFKKYAPQVVFHAAAHKHVPLLESNTSEAVLNNIFGAAQLLRCAADHQVERCVMVSSDKAVNPTNIMGATKRVAELMFQAQALRLNGKSHYSCVRFGNVLGSRGSVVPIFREQIKQGGPITVTDPEVERYFMTIPEAAQLIIQAGAMGQRGEIFLLDMGEPVKVVDLARDMIRLSGLTVGEDMDIEFIGLRPGEKLKEELLIADEGARTTRHEKIFIAPPLKYDFARLEESLRHLTAAVEEGNDERIYQLFLTMGIGFRPHRPEKENGDESRPAENRAHH